MLDPDIFGLRLFGAHEGLSSSNFTSFGDGHKCPSLAKITPKNSLWILPEEGWPQPVREIVTCVTAGFLADDVGI